MSFKALKRFGAAALAAAAVLSAAYGCFGTGQPAPSEAAERTAGAEPAQTAEGGSPAVTGSAEPLPSEPAYDNVKFLNADGLDVLPAARGITALAEVFGTEPAEVTVEVGEYELPFYEGGRVFVSAGDIGSLGLVAAAARAYRDDLPDWVYRGAAQLAVNGKERVLLKLGAALDKEDRINALALLPVRFAPRFNNEESLKLSYRTAGGFLQFIIEKYGDIRLDNAAEDKLEFVNRLGLEGKYEGLYEGLLDGCGVSFNVLLNDRYADNVLFPVVIESETYTLYAQPLTDCANAAQLEALIYKLEVGKQLMRAFVEEHADRYLYVCEFDSRVTYYMLNSYGFSYAQGNNVVLRLESKAILHETVHQWIMPTYYDHWYYEGLADFLALQGGEGESLEFVNSMARLAFMHPDVYGGGGVGDYNNTPASERVKGDEFTYDQSNSLIAYICETYTLDPILAVSDGNDFDSDFEKAFGKTFEEVVAEWREWLG